MKLLARYIPRFLSFLFATVFMANTAAQELNCNVVVNADLVNQTNQQVFRTLERSLKDYVNKTKWTTRTISPNERINCNMLITVNQFENNSFVATLQVQSNRPVFNSTYETPVFNHQDKQFSFTYSEFEPLFFNPNVFESNLTAVINYYVYIILGIDADTFETNGGTPYFQQAQSIVNLSQGSNFAGWNQADGNRTRWELVDNLLNNTFKEYRLALYNYHRLGLDLLVDNKTLAKQSISGCMKMLESLNNTRPNSFVMQTFFDAKAEEIAQIFSGGPKTDVASLKTTLNKIAPLYANLWDDIKF